ncbi:MAG: DNA polymerase Y family protein [Kiloniellales bacterium]|nr:DNA polymerase Y family protein [Kiloniellales bacterium]
MGTGGPVDPAAGPQRPLALVARDGGRSVLAAVDEAAALAGLAPGLPLAGAHALAPDLETAPHDPQGDAAALARLAVWCEGMSPWTASDGLELGGAAGLRLDVTGCAHLFGGERALLADLEAWLAARGFAARAALAETLGGAWALARFGPAASPDGDPAIGESAGRLVPPGGLRAALAPLPPAALRLPAETCELLGRLGLRRIGDLLDLPPAALAPRFGPLLARRLRQALGAEAEPLAPGAPPPPPEVRRSFAEPIATPEDLARALASLSATLCERLEAAGLGVRRLVLTALRVDGGRQSLGVGTSRPRRDPDHLAGLFRDRLERLDPGFGVEAMTLRAARVEPLAPSQKTLSKEYVEDFYEGEISDLLDRLTSRLGAGSVHGLAPRDSHLPERAVAAVPALEGLKPAQPWRRGQPRPLRLFDPPQPVEALALLPDHPPERFRWRRLQHRVVRAEGPERLTGEWWGDDASSDSATVPDPETRDYFRVEDEDGRRYWLYRRVRDGTVNGADDWFLHGLFA